MSIRHVKNETTFNLKRDVRCETVELVDLTAGELQENNTNIVGADVAIPNDIVYAGRDHLPIGTAQYDANDI